MTKGRIVVSNVSPRFGFPGKDPLRVLLDAIRQAGSAPTIAERRTTVIRLLSEHGIRIDDQDPLFELADAYGAHYRKIAGETVESELKRSRKGSPTASLWAIVIGSASAAWATGLVVGPLLFMRQVEPRYALVGFLSMLFGGLLVGAVGWLVLRANHEGGNDASR